MKKKQTATNESLLSTVKPSRAIVELAIPATLALLAKAVYNIVDTAYIGMLKDDIALTAVGVTVPLLLIMVSIENIFAAGAAVLAGRQLGSKDTAGASRTVTTVIGLSVGIGIVLCVGGIVFIEPVMRAFGASEASLPQAKEYAFWMFRGAGQSACPKHELRGPGRILGEDLLYRCHHRRGAERDPGPHLHV